MGYVYEIRGGRRLLCCDVCGHAGGVRRVSCRYGYCPATAMCAGCRADSKVRAEMRDHCETHCKAASAEYAAEKARREEALDAGLFVRCSARNADGGMVKVTFENRTGEKVDRLVTEEVYRAHGLLATRTLADYELEVA